MYKMGVITLFVVFFKTIFASTFSNSTDSVHLHQTDDKVLEILDDLFIALKISKNFSKSKNVEDYMSKHSLIQDALCNNRKKYKEIRDMSKTDVNHKTSYYISNINEVVDEMIQQENAINAENTKNVSNTLVDESPGFVKLARRFNMKLKTLDVPKLPSTKIQDEGRRIFEGSSTGIERYPFMVSVHVAGRFVCAGSLLHVRLAVSAGSCLMRHSPADVHAEIQLRVGSNYVSKMGYLVNVEELIFHPQFDRTTLANNLVLLRTRKALRFKYQTVVAIQYDRAASSALKSNVEDVVILGWGRRKTDDADLEEDRPLSEAHLEMYEFKACQYIYTRDFVTDKTFCAGFVDRGAGACNHDAGGPAVVKNVLAGVISFGSPHCGAAEAPTVFTRLGHYDQWIEGVFQQLAENPDIISENQTDVSKKTLRGDILNLDEALKDVYRENLNVDDVLYGPIENMYDGEMLNMSKESYMHLNPSDPSVFPNPKLIENVPTAKTLKENEIPDGYWRDSSSELIDPTNENNNLEDTKTKGDHNRIYNYGPVDIYEDNVAQTIVSTTTKAAAGKHFSIKHNIIKYKEQLMTTSERSILRENPIMTSLAIETSHQSQPIIRLFEDSIGKPEKDLGELKQSKTPNNSGSEMEDEMAVIVLSDSGTTQRIEVHRRDPLYAEEIKTLAAKIVRAQGLA